MRRGKKTNLWLYERAAIAEGRRFVAGVDEAGRGPLAGPVVAAAVILPLDCDITGINDSKQLTPERREEAFDKIMRLAVGIGVGLVEEKEIDRINILQATHRAMRAAISGLPLRADFCLIDGYPIRDFEYRHIGIIDGDCKSVSIAAASIIAKVTRDRIMCKFDELYPLYGFARHKGYSTDEHLQNLAAHGVCEIHRRSFAPVADQLDMLWHRSELPAAGSRTTKIEIQAKL